MASDGSNTNATTHTLTSPQVQVNVVSQFLESLVDYEPTIPDETIRYLIEKTGCNSPDLRLIRLIGIAASRMAWLIIDDALQSTKLSLPAVKRDSTSHFHLSLDRLSQALEAQGVDVVRQPYFLSRSATSSSSSSSSSSSASPSSSSSSTSGAR